jgi:hypothetical protein
MDEKEQGKSPSGSLHFPVMQTVKGVCYCIKVCIFFHCENKTVKLEKYVQEITLFWYMRPCNLVDIYTNVPEEPAAVIFRP